MAEDVSASLGWQLADTIRAMVKQKTGPTTGTAQYVGRDSAGNALVLLPGAEQPTPVQGSVSASADVGSTVTYSLANGRLSITGNTSDPAVGESRATQIADVVVRPVAAALSVTTAATNAARSIADAAQRVASAINQHFWSDTDGVHVTQVSQEEWQDSEGTSYQSGPNVLINSIGQLFREGLNNLLSLLPAQTQTDTFTGDGMTTAYTLSQTPVSVTSVTVGGTETTDYALSGTTLTLTTAPASDSEVVVAYKTSETVIAIWDGAGNAASNVVASFGRVVTLGEDGDVRTLIESGAFRIVDSVLRNVIQMQSDNTHDGLAYIAMRSTGDGSTTTYNPGFTIDTTVGVRAAYYLDVTPYEDMVPPEISSNRFVFATPPTSGRPFRVEYATSDMMYRLSFGTRSGTIGINSTVMGRGNTASDSYAFAFGRSNVASGQDAYAIGRANTASGRSAYALGNAAEASANDAIAIGNGAYAGGTGAIALGNNATATAGNSYALGRYVSAESSDQMVIGRYNEADNVGTYSFVLGNGSSASDLHNAFAVDSETGKVHSWNKSTGSSGFVAQRDETGTAVYFIVGAGGINHGVWSGPLGRWLVYADNSNAYINNNLIMDSVGWTNLKLSSTAEVYSDASYTPKYCRKCGIVYLAGAVTPKASVSAQGTLTIGTLPVGCRPMVRTVLLCQGSTSHEWSLTVETNGVVQAGRYRSGGTFEEMPSGAWLTFSVAFVSADAY